MREDDERFIEKIEKIIHSIIGIEEGSYGWGGQEYRLTRTEVAARKIFDLIKESHQTRKVK